MSSISSTYGLDALSRLLTDPKSSGSSKGFPSEIVTEDLGNGSNTASLTGVSVDIRFEQASISLGSTSESSSGNETLTDSFARVFEKLKDLNESLASSFLGILQALGQLNDQIQSAFADLVGQILDQSGIGGASDTNAISGGGTTGSANEQTALQFEASFQSIQARIGDGSSLSVRSVTLEFQANFGQFDLLQSANAGFDNSNIFSAFTKPNQFALGQLLNTLA